MTGGGGGSGGGPKNNPFSAMPVGSSTAIPSGASSRWGRRWGAAGGGVCGGGLASLAAFLGLLFASTLLLLRWGPAAHAGTLRRGDPNYVDPARIDPSLYSDFTPQLILREGHEDWVAFEKAAARHYFTAAELSSLPPSKEERQAALAAAGGDKAAAEAAGKAQCHASDEMPQHCCLGSFSLAGLMAWAGDACLDADFYKFQVPHRSDPGQGLGRYHDMGDVLRRLGNRTLSFLGDSVASQHAHAMECSWLRSGKARTVFYEKEDYHRIFSANGTGFSRAGRYGTNALYTWRAETTSTSKTTTPSAKAKKEGPEAEAEGQGHPGGVQATMKLYMTYRPLANDTKALLDSSDAVVVNFGLHYLLEDRRVFEEEMQALLELARPFAATPGKALVWRESSAQHHLSEGGEFPVTEFPERLGVSKLQSLHMGPLCHPLRFGAKVAPQWRDRIVLRLADALGYRVHFLGGYEGERLLEGGGGGLGQDEEEAESGPAASSGRERERERLHHARRRRGVDSAAVATEGEGEEEGPKTAAPLPPPTPSAVGPPPRERRQLAGATPVSASAAAVVGADGSVREGEGPEAAEEEEDVEEEAEEDEAARPVLYWMPFFRTTASRHDLHPYNPWRKRYDCTHYCYTPFLWDPLVDALHGALADRYHHQPPPKKRGRRRAFDG